MGTGEGGMGDGGIGEPVVLARAGPLRIGSLLVEPAICVLRDEAGQEEAIEPRVMQVLVALARAEGAPVSRNELIASCWDGRIVSNDAITRVISILRKLARNIGGGSFEVETLNKVGYRLRVTSAASDPIRTPQPGQTTFAASRRGLLAMGVVGIAALGAGWWVSKPGLPKSGISTQTRLVIAPFTADAADRELVQFARGAGDAIRNDIGRVPGVQIVDSAAGNTAAPSRGTQKTIEPGLVLTGNLERHDVSVRLFMTIADLGSGNQIWSGVVDGRPTNRPDLARDAAGAVIEQLVLLLPVDAWQAEVQSLRADPEAYRLSIEARALCDDVRESLLAGRAAEAQHLSDHASALASRALAIDPEHPDALVVLATLTRNGWSRAFAAQSLTTQQRVEHAHAILRRALRSDPRNAGAMTGLADIYRRFGWRWDDAETLFRHALANDPANAGAHWAYSHELATLGRAREGLDQACALLAIDHVHLWRRITLPRMLYCFGDRDRAIGAYYRELAASPGNPFLLWEIYYLFVAEGNGAALNDFVERLEKLQAGGNLPASVEAIIARCRAAIDAMAGRPETLLAILDSEREGLDANTLTQATLGGRARDDLGFILAIEYAHAAQYDQAIALLDQALAAMSVYWIYSLPYGNAPFPLPMRQDPRFQALWRRDPRLVDAVQRRQRAASTGQMATALPDGTITRPEIGAALNARIEAALAMLPASAH